MYKTFLERERIGFYVSSIFCDSAFRKGLFGGCEETKAVMRVFGEINDPKVGYESNAFSIVSCLMTS